MSGTRWYQESGQRATPEVVTTNSDGQPRATFDTLTGFVRVTFDGRTRFLSAAMAEEFAWSIEHAARLARQTR